MPDPHTSAEPQPWEQQDREPTTAYAAFTIYRDLDPRQRSLARVASELVSGTRGSQRISTLRRSVEGYSSKWSWVDRVRAWDGEKDRARREAYLEESAAMGRRQATEAQAMQAVMMAPVKQFLQRLAEAQARNTPIFEELSLNDLFRLSTFSAQYWPAVAKFERLARGEPTEEIGVPEAPAQIISQDEYLAKIVSAFEEAQVPWPGA